MANKKPRVPYKKIAEWRLRQKPAEAIEGLIYIYFSIWPYLILLTHPMVYFSIKCALFR